MGGVGVRVLNDWELSGGLFGREFEILGNGALANRIEYGCEK